MIPLGGAAALTAVERRRAMGNPAPWSDTAFNGVDTALFTLMVVLAVNERGLHTVLERPRVERLALELHGLPLARLELAR